MTSFSKHNETVTTTVTESVITKENIKKHAPISASQPIVAMKSDKSENETLWDEPEVEVERTTTQTHTIKHTRTSSSLSTQSSQSQEQAHPLQVSI